ncbi:RICIN domain-containing protein [Saccharothrix sp. Mg75]|uniref:RICIN domain-containing protein n=1 Tax=Saccharothrix sp. Mg75 TaxID=3445357 RepID=UPI003EEB4C87
MTGRLSRLLSVVLLIGSGLVGGAGIGGAEAVPVPVVFENAGSDERCLDVTSYAGGTPATLYGCYGGVSQTWVREDNGTISNLGSGRAMCLDVSSYADNSPVHLYPCYNAASQQWTVTASNKVRNVGGGGGICLDVQSYADYSPALIFPCQVTQSQVWSPW